MTISCPTHIPARSWSSSSWSPWACPRTPSPVPPRRINELVHGRRAVTADTDLRLARYFGLSDGFFLGLQADHDLMAQRRKLVEELASIEPRAA